MENEKKNSRPAKEKYQVREIVKHIRYSSEEWAEVEKKLEASNLCYSEFVRRATHQVTITPVNMEAIRTLRAVRNDLLKIGTNINLIARHGANVTDAASLNRFLQDLNNCKALAEELKPILEKIQDTIR